MSQATKIRGQSLLYGYLEILVSVYGRFSTKRNITLLHSCRLLFPFQRINHTKIEWLEFADAVCRNYLHILHKICIHRMRMKHFVEEQKFVDFLHQFWHLVA